MAVSALAALRRWFDNEVGEGAADVEADNRIDWLRVVPFVALHAACLAALWVGVSPIAIAVAVVLYAVRMFGITAFYHRYCSHRAYATSRPMQFALALVAGSAAQRGPLWWASHHRHHHAHSDRPEDAHSARQHGFLWSHLGWFLSRQHFAARRALVADLAASPELRFLDRFDVVAPVALGIALYALGELLGHYAPTLNTNGAQLFVWGFCISTVVLYHATFAINSLAHRFGQRRYATTDDSRNSWWLALLTLGEGWHNNHHHFPGAARQGFFWWEVDVTYWVLRALQAAGLVWNVREVPPRLLSARLVEGRP